MVVVEFAYEDMRRLVDLPREKIVDSLNELGAPAEYEKGVDKIIAELTPNRPDWYSMEGLARALKAYHGKGAPSYNVKKSDYKVIVDPSVKKIRPYTVCAVVKGVEFNDQRIKDMVLLQEKLLGTLGRRVKKFGLGLYPLHAIRFPVRYTTMKPEEIRYVPLGHEEQMSAKEILEKHKKGQEHGHLIKGFERYPVFKDAGGRVMALVPVVNSAETGKVDESTRDLFIEVTGTELHACKAALNILVCTFADMGGEVYSVKLDYGKDNMVLPDLSDVVMEFDLGRANRLLGLGLKEKEAADLLAKMGYRYRKGKIHVPPYRADILGEIDITEDLAIAYGYNRFRPTIPDFFNPGDSIKEQDALDRVMLGMGFVETKTFVLTNKEKLELVGADKGAVEISNPCTSDYTVVRPTLIVDMLDTFRINKMKGLPQRFYEIGVVHDGRRAAKRLVFGVMDKKLEFSAVRGYLQTICSEKGHVLALDKRDMVAFDPEISCVVRIDGKDRGVFGKVDRSILEKVGLGFEVYICELEL